MVRILRYDTPRQTLLKLLRVCHQLYHETALLPYQLAIFEFGYEFEGFFDSFPPHSLEKFLLNRPREQVEAIGRIRVYEFDMTQGILSVSGQWADLRTGLSWFTSLGL